MHTELRAGLTAALRTRDRVAIAALRSALAAIDNAEAVPAAPVDGSPDKVAGSAHVAGSVAGLGAAQAQRRQLSDAELRSIVEKEVRDRSVAAAEYDRLSRAEAAGQLRAEAQVLSGYLGG